MAKYLLDTNICISLLKDKYEHFDDVDNIKGMFKILPMYQA